MDIFDHTKKEKNTYIYLSFYIYYRIDKNLKKKPKVNIS